MGDLVNPVSGERVRVLSESAEVLELELAWPPGRRRTPAHAHPGMEERWEVVRGEAAFTIGDREHRAGPGDSVVAPAGTPHQAWNAGTEEAIVRVRMRPPLRWRAFLEQLFDLLEREPGAVPALLAEHPDEIAFP